MLVCRKILMNLAVEHGANPGESFKSYIQYLSDTGYIPPNGKPWVERIKDKGNEATHEIPSVSMEDASQVLNFVEMLLRSSYEFPAMWVRAFRLRLPWEKETHPPMAPRRGMRVRKRQ